MMRQILQRHVIHCGRWKAYCPQHVQPKHLLIHMGEQNDVVQLHLHTQVMLLGIQDGSHCAEGTQSLVNH